MKWDQLSIEAVCESSILIRFSNEIDTQLPKYISAIAEVIVSEHQDVIMSVTPSYTTLLIDYLPFRISEQELLTSIANLLHSIELYPEEDRQQSIVLPVYYHESVAPDLISVMEDKKLTLEQLIELHTGREYTVCAIGFAPGFAFLAHVDQVLATPRLATPRLKVLKGSVGIADTQTAVYPSDTPGGWNIIGNCPVELFDPDSDQLSPFRVGEKVRFQSIDKYEYKELGGKLWR
ncbi:5-oxoprolinase subunit PxpB [Vibrio hannami]|uniref:5-oxoprolinase subunit PxpB n=1 Tax=Vibrio hannami TaxID=2717094 RepID=UPI003EB7C5B9